MTESLILGGLNLLLLIGNFIWSWWKGKSEQERINREIEEKSHEAAEKALRTALESLKPENDQVIDVEDTVDAFVRSLKSRPPG